MNKEIKMLGPSITNHEISKVNKMMKDGWDNYKYVEEFEDRFAQYHQRGYCLMTPCCTHAIHLGLLGIGLNPKDEVIVPQCTWTGSVAPITYIGARPVFVDISRKSWCIDFESIKKAVNNTTKAIIGVDLYGKMPEYIKLEKLCEEKNIILIEDAAEALGSTYKNKKAGSFGHFSVHSFHRTKTITTGEGGALLTDDQSLYERCKFLRDHGRSNTTAYYIEEASQKYMPSNLMGALGCAQMDRIQELINMKRRIRDLYVYYLDNKSINYTTIDDSEDGINGSWATTIVIENNKFDRDTAIEYFKLQALPIRPFFRPLTEMKAYQLYNNNKLSKENSIYISNRGLTLPSHYEIKEESIELIVNKLDDHIRSLE